MSNVVQCPNVYIFNNSLSLTIVLSLMEPKLRMKSSHPTSVGSPEDWKKTLIGFPGRDFLSQCVMPCSKKCHCFAKHQPSTVRQKRLPT